MRTWARPDDTFVMNQPSGQIAAISRRIAAVAAGATALVTWPALVIALIMIVESLHGSTYDGAGQFVLMFYGTFGWPVVILLGAVFGSGGRLTGGAAALRGLLTACASVVPVALYALAV